MSEQILRDSPGKVLGIVTSMPDKAMSIRIGDGRYRGSYDPNTNLTRTGDGKLAGTGNLLAMLTRTTSR